MKKLTFLFFLLCVIVLLSGCWDRKDIEERGLVAIMGVDKAVEVGKVEVTVQIIKPGGIQAGQASGGEAEAVAVYSAVGYNLFDAVRNLAKQIGRELYFPEMTVMVLGEELARESIGAVMDFIERYPEPSMRVWILVSKGRAREVLETPIPTAKVWGYGLENLVKTTSDHSKAPAVDVLDFQKSIVSNATCPIATGIEIIKDDYKKSLPETVDPAKKPILSDTAVFRDYTMIGWLDEKQTRGMLWVQGKVRGGIVIVPYKEYGEFISLEVINSDSQIKPIINDGRIILTVKVSVESNIDETKPDNLGFNNPDTIEGIEARQRGVIERNILAAVSRAQEMNADVFGFGEALKAKYPQEWKQYESNWKEMFSTLDVLVEVDNKIRRTGLINNPEVPNTD